MPGLPEPPVEPMPEPAVPGDLGARGAVVAVGRVFVDRDLEIDVAALAFEVVE